MKGLLRNNLYATLSNAKVFSGFMILFGIFAVAVISPSLQISYAMIGIIGFSVNAIAVTKNEYISKWGKYKLTLPVKRTDIVKSLFLNQIIWLLVGTFFVGIEICLSWLFHGCPFDQAIDVLTMFALGISISLFLGAVFFPLFFVGGEEKSEVLLIISVLCASGVDFAIVSVVNALLEPGIAAIMCGALILLICSLLTFALSYLLTAKIFKKKEY